MEFKYQVGPEIKAVRIERRDGAYYVTVGKQTYAVKIHKSGPDTVTFSVDGQPHRCVHVVSGEDGIFVAFYGANVVKVSRANQANTARRRHHAEGDKRESLTASMTGQVVRVLVDEGQQVARGQALVLLEAMKMEIRVTAPHAGRVARLLCRTGQVVERGQTLIEIEPDEMID